MKGNGSDFFFFCKIGVNLVVKGLFTQKHEGKRIRKKKKEEKKRF